MLCCDGRSILPSHKHTQRYFLSLQVGDREDSNLYISMKLKAAAEVIKIIFDVSMKSSTYSYYTLIWKSTIMFCFMCQIGINATHKRLPQTATEEEVRLN